MVSSSSFSEVCSSSPIADLLPPAVRNENNVSQKLIRARVVFEGSTKIYCVNIYRYTVSKLFLTKRLAPGLGGSLTNSSTIDRTDLTSDTRFHLWREYFIILQLRSPSFQSLDPYDPQSQCAAVSTWR